MSRKNKKRQKARTKALLSSLSEASLRKDYEHLCRMAEQGQHEQAQGRLEGLERAVSDVSLRAQISNDLATLALIRGDPAAARQRLQAALALDPKCEPARTNLAFLDQEEALQQQGQIGNSQSDRPQYQDPKSSPQYQPPRIRVALLSMLFNWPSTGGGNVHTYELAIFLARAGYEVKHFYVRYHPWQIGSVPAALPFASESLEFDGAAFTASQIQARFRQAVERFDPDNVIVTDSWNFKPLLAEAVTQFPYLLRMQASECLCPLNNVRLLPQAGGGVRQCHLHQLAFPNDCYACLRERGQMSGSLHQAERALSGVGSPEYYDRLVRVVRDAEAVLVVNPHAEALFAPYARKVCVVTAGMDPARFPWPDPRPPQARPPIHTFLFAGLVAELMKGYHILREACSRLWQQRHDFRLVVTDQPTGPVEPFAQYVGWQSQGDLPRWLYEADVLVMPTIAQEGLGRTAVEAMAAGRPVVASRLGGLIFTVKDGVTGLLCEPGDAEDLAAKLARLMDDAALRQQMGLAGRKRFEEHYAWPVIIERHYRPLLQHENTKKRKSERRAGN
jgi:glycosyltransferase involved in cell wall biosynthesis